MLRQILMIGAVVLASGTFLSAQNASPAGDEEAAWNIVKDAEASGDVFAFIERYPNGAFVKEAKAKMIDLLWLEMAATTPNIVSEAPDIQETVPVTFSGPLTQGAPEIVGKSIEELIAGSPLFPPIDGLPESYWKAQECSSCHEWERANLCDQANTYLSDAGAESLRKQHPYGGTFKLNLQSWATGGCE